MKSIFEEEFYPTPKEVIDRMMMGVNVSGKVVLEPSAGTGNIVDWLKEAGAREVLACERNHDLQRIVSQKCDLICDDFLKLTAEEISHIDMIVMNPPFSTAAHHILHAFEIAPSGCEIIAICNSQTIENTYSMARKRLAEIIEFNGGTEDLEQCFKNAARPTDVWVTLVKLYKPGEGNHEFDGYLFSDEEEEEYNGSEGLMPYNVIRDVVNRYIMAVSKFDAVMAASQEINDLSSLIGGCSIKFGAYRSNKNFHSTVTREMFKKQLQKESWSFIFNKLNMSKFVTSKVRETINNFVEQQQNVPFTMRNIYTMLDMIVKTQGNRMNQSLVEAFELICSFSAENSTAGETWKTNANYMVNRKFIVPYMCSYDSRWTKEYIDISWGGNVNKMTDLITALNYISGIQREDSLYNFLQQNNIPWGEWVEWGYFRIKGFKKGTMHFEFRDDKLWMDFNQRVAKIKGWALPKKTEKKSRSKKAV